MTNVTATTFVVAQVYVFPYNVQANTIVSIGLYIGKSLVAQQNYSLSSYTSHPASILTPAPGSSVATFSQSLAGFPVTAILNQPLPAGTQITVLVEVNNIVWLQTDNTGARQSFILPASPSTQCLRI